MIETQKYQRKTFEVDAVQVTAENMATIAEWCGGTVEEDQNRKFIKVPVSRPIDERQTMAFAGCWVLQAGTGFKVYTGKAFGKSFEQVSAAVDIQATPAPAEELRVVSAPVPTAPVVDAVNVSTSL